MTVSGFPGDPHGGRRREAYPDYDATIVLPVVPSAGLNIDDATALLPRVVPSPTAPVGGWASPVAPGGGAPGNTPAGPTAVDEDEQQSVVRNSAVMAAGSLVSRVTGLLRTIAISAALGASFIGNDYNLANTVPNMVYELLLGGVLASVLVPFLMRARLRDTDKGDAYAQRLLTLAVVLLGGATVLAVAAAPLLTKLFTLTARDPRPTSADLHLITTLSYLILPEIFFYGVAALLAAILNTRGHFAAPTWTPILNNIVVIATAVLFIVLPSSPKVTPVNISTMQVLVLGVGTTLGIVVQAMGLLPALRRVRFHWKWRFDWGQLQLRDLGRASSWMLVYVLVSQVALIVLLMIGYAVGSKITNGSTAPGIAIYNNAFLIFMMAHGIVAVSIMTALMPRLSAAAAEGRFGDLAAQFSQGTRLSSVILIPTTAAYIVLNRPLAVSLFQWGEYTHLEAKQTGTVIAVAAIGLVPFAISQMQLFAFYAMPDTKTPALLNIPVAAVRILFYVVFYLVLPLTLATAGLMMANTVSYVLGALIGYALLRRRIGRLGLGETMRALAKLAGAAVVGGLAAWFVVIIAEHTIGGGKAASIVTLVAGGAVLLAVYVGTALALKARDISEVAGMVRGRLGR